MILRTRPGSVAVIVAPHPDDEIIGAAHLIRHLVLRRVRVRVVIVSDGAASHPNSVHYPPRRLIGERRRESRRALRRLGVAAGAVAFLNLPDGRVGEPQGECTARLHRALAKCRDIDVLVGPALDDAHPDHRAVAASLTQFRRARLRLAYRVWPHDRAGGPGLLRLSGATVTAKRSLIEGYRTQRGAIRDDPDGFTLARHELAAFAHPVETFVRVRG